MARLSRLTVPHQMHYVVQRGHGTQPVFVDDQDRAAYLHALRIAASDHRVSVHAFVLLDDQVQWLASPQDAHGLSRAVQATGQRFVGAFNRRHGLRGTRWEGRFRSALVEAAIWGLPLSLMIEQEPVVRQGVTEAAQWPWSTARHHLGLERLPWIVDSPVLWQLGNTPYEREAAYAAALRIPQSDKHKCALTNAAARGWAYGSKSFLDSVAKIAGRSVGPKPRGRPKSV